VRIAVPADGACSGQTFFRRAALACAAFVLALFGAASPALGQSFTVNSTADLPDQTPGDGICATGRTAPDGSGNPECTLRAAIQESNADSGPTRIAVPAGTYFLTQPTGCSETYAGESGPEAATIIALCVTGQMTISGAGSSTTIIDAGNNDRVAQVSANAIVEFQRVTLQNGTVRGGFFGGGGAINNQGNLTIDQSVLSGNTAVTGAGGALFNAATLTITNSTLSGNTSLGEAGGNGGAIYNSESQQSVPGTIVIADSTIVSNAADASGGGIYLSFGSLTITGSTLSANLASGSGGGLVVTNGASLVATNSTIIGNQAFVGGGLRNFTGGTVSLNGVTIAQNSSTTATNGGGVYNSGALTLENSILGENTAGGQASDCDGFGAGLTSQGHNLLQSVTCKVSGITTTNVTGKDPLLGTLASNGGPTRTLALLAGSPALDAGDPGASGSGGTACAATDQRGYFRPQGAHCDIGAFEQVAGLSVTAITPPQGGTGGTVTATVSGSGFVAGATVALRRQGQTSILASPVAVEAGQAALTASFNLGSASAGSWDVVITNPDTTSAVLPGAFTIGPAQSPQLWVDVAGRNSIRPGVPVTYTILFGNRGNVDAYDVPLTLATPSNFMLTLAFPIAPPPFNPAQVVTNWTGVPVEVVTSPQSGILSVPFFLPVIPAGYTGALDFALEPPSSDVLGDSFTIQLGIGSPFSIFNAGLDPNIIGQFVSDAQDYSATNLEVTIPQALTPNLTTYITTQLQNLTASGLNDLAASTGSQSDVYSLSQLVIDLATYGAALATSSAGGQQPRLDVIGLATSGAAEGRAQMHVTRHASGSGAGLPSRNCNTGQVMMPGTSACTNDPTPVPSPNPPPGIPKGITRDQCLDLPDHHVSSDGSACLPTPDCNQAMSTSSLCRPFKIINSEDPNDKSGPGGVGTSQFVSSLQTFDYNIAFENQSTATAPAQQVTITDQLDATNLDLTTFSLGPISFGTYIIVPPAGQNQFEGGLDLRPAQNIQVKVQASLNTTTGVATWVFQSIDPSTGQLTTDPSAGFLPPDVNPPAGMGAVAYSAKTKPGIATNTTTCNQASVVFDFNAPLNTPTWCNAFDNTPPVSQVTALPAAETNPSFTVQWSGTDAGSGIASYSIYVSDSGGPFSAFQNNTTNTSATFAGQVGHSYGFYSIATDLVGNVEGPKSTAEATTTVTTPCATDVTGSISLIRSGYVLNFGTQRFYQTVTLTNTSGSAIGGPIALNLESLSGDAALFNKSGTTSCAAPLGGPYINATSGSLASHASVSVVLQFTDPTRGSITYTPRVLAGGGTF